MYITSLLYATNTLLDLDSYRTNNTYAIGIYAFSASLRMVFCITVRMGERETSSKEF